MLETFPRPRPLSRPRLLSRRRALAATALLLLLLFVLPAGAFAGVERRTFDVADGGRLSVDSDLGSIRVQAGGRGKVEVTVEVSGNRAEEFRADFTQDGDEVRVRGHYQRGFWGWASNPKVEMTIKVPARFDVDLDTSGGSISVADLTGEVRAETSGGSLAFTNVRGPVSGETSGGSIALDGSVGDVRLDTSGGSITIGDVDGDVYASTSGGTITIERARGNVEASTSGGSIRVEEVFGTIRAATSGGSVSAYIAEQPEGECRLSTSGGSVTAYLAASVGVDLDAQASGGGVKSELPVAAERRTRTSLAGTINGGGPRLYLRSSGGGVRVERR